MSLTLRIFLIVGALFVFVLVLRRIRKAQLHTSDAIFWFILAFCLVILAIFPQIAYWCSNMLGFISPSNFIFLCLVAILMAKVFSLSIEIAKLRSKLNQIAEYEALDQNTVEDNARRRSRDKIENDPSNKAS